MWPVSDLAELLPLVDQLENLTRNHRFCVCVYTSLNRCICLFRWQYCSSLVWTLADILFILFRLVLCMTMTVCLMCSVCGNDNVIVLCMTLTVCPMCCVCGNDNVIVLCMTLTVCPMCSVCGNDNVILKQKKHENQTFGFCGLNSR